MKEFSVCYDRFCLGNYTLVCDVSDTVQATADLGAFNQDSERTVDCSKGTHIRSLCADIGAKLGCGACLHSLNRIRSGEFDLADAYDIETMRTWEQPELENAVNDFLHKKLQRMNLSAF